ncbi:hypothetical protein JFJ09_11355 [Pseudoalteromonas arctica]|uniref:hypothetical protein n=1 Tax=Pseudoalteromonas arctica TaxID=394751 RepID=UPI001C9BE2F2|nr:hypothetical protein [Pseudoalteromonas arctica]MBZ2192814.1 hypothetical protein [Pseudoalteromonas arctica]
MLFIYGSLTIGGIETFFVRMAKQRKLDGLDTTVLLLSKPKESDDELLSEMKKYAEVYFYFDIFHWPQFLIKSMPLLAAVKKEKLNDIFKKVDQIHVSDGELALLGYRFINLLELAIPISVGFYNPVKFSWGGDRVKYYEKINREFVLNYLPKSLLALFSKNNLELYNSLKNVDITGANTFRLGVVDLKTAELENNDTNSSALKICSVGRLLEYKTYNFYMVDIIYNLINKGLDVEYHIYGEGDFKPKLLKKIKALGLDKNVKLMGDLPYSMFNTTVASYDLFIGSGTAIIQASSLGVCSIVGIEKVDKPITYGFFSEVYEYEYNILNLDLPTLGVEKLIIDFINSNSKDKLLLKKAHLNCIYPFTNENCAKLMNDLNTIRMPVKKFKYNSFFHQITKNIDTLYIKISKNHPRNSRK